MPAPVAGIGASDVRRVFLDARRIDILSSNSSTDAAEHFIQNRSLYPRLPPGCETATSIRAYKGDFISQPNPAEIGDIDRGDIPYHAGISGMNEDAGLGKSFAGSGRPHNQRGAQLSEWAQRRRRLRQIQWMHGADLVK